MYIGYYVFRSGLFCYIHDHIENIAASKQALKRGDKEGCTKTEIERNRYLVNKPELIVD